jgi:exosortase
MRISCAPGIALQLRSPKVWLCAVGAAAFIWSYWSTFTGLAERWSKSPQYSHGFLIPAFAAVVLWLRRHRVKFEELRPDPLGLGLLLVGALIRLFGAFFYFPWFDDVSLLPSIAGLGLLLGGREALRWCWPAVGFLAFMLPLPFVVEGALAGRLQSFATFASTYLLQTMGFPALSEGNVIIINDSKIGVAEACNGLGMLVVFFALTTAIAFIVVRPLWEKVLIVLSAVPIALAANVIRITMRGMLGEWFGEHVAQVVFHDWGGWLMMPLALVMLWLEIKLISWLVCEPKVAVTTPLVPVIQNPPRSGKKARARRAAGLPRVVGR